MVGRFADLLGFVFRDLLRRLRSHAGQPDSRAGCHHPDERHRSGLVRPMRGWPPISARITTTRKSHRSVARGRPSPETSPREKFLKKTRRCRPAARATSQMTPSMCPVMRCKRFTDPADTVLDRCIRSLLGAHPWFPTGPEGLHSMCGDGGGAVQCAEIKTAGPCRPLQLPCTRGHSQRQTISHLIVATSFDSDQGNDP
jgi:hypothetical protein